MLMTKMTALIRTLTCKWFETQAMSMKTTMYSKFGSCSKISTLKMTRL